MSEKILFAHHHEPYWGEGLDKFGTTFEKEHLALIDHILFSGEEYDRVITTSFENIDPEGIELLIEICHHAGIKFQHEQYGYGMTRDEHSIDTYPIEEINDTWCFGNRNYHTEEDVLDIHDWMRDLKDSEVHLVGAFEGECLNDMETIFDSININYSLIPPLCVGPSQPEYEMQGEAMIGSLQSDIIQENERIQDEIFESLDKYDVADFGDLMNEKPKVAYKHLVDFCDQVDKYADGIENMSSNVSMELIQALYPDTPIAIELSCDENEEAFNKIFSERMEGINSTESIRNEAKNLEKMKSNYPSPSYNM